MMRNNASKDNRKQGQHKSSTLEEFVSKDSLTYFSAIRQGDKMTLCDEKSAAHSKIAVEAVAPGVYYARPDRDIIPSRDKQKKADYLVFCCGGEGQANFFELKGEKISESGREGPWEQILATIIYFASTDGLEKIVAPKVEKHAFIVSPGRQSIPSGIQSCERKLLRRLGTASRVPQGPSKFLHYVKFQNKADYSECAQRIICSPAHPLKIPYKNGD